MVIEESFIKATDGVRLLIPAEWGEPPALKAIIVLLHGRGEHCQRYEHVARMACERISAMLSYDRQGTAARRQTGVIGSVDQLVADFSQVIAHAR